MKNSEKTRKNKRGAGRPTKVAEWLTDDGLKRIRGWAQEKKRNQDIAQLMGISITTFKEWNNKYPTIKAALQEGRRPVLVDLKDNMLSRCEWRQVEEETSEIIEKADGTKERRMKRTKRWIPPDCGMMQFMAKNWMPNEFSDHPVAEVDDSKELIRAKEILGGVSSVIN